MVGADPILAGVWKGAPWYGDFFLTERSQCNFASNVSLASGVCPDEAYGAFANTKLIGYQRIGNIRTFVFERPLVPSNSMVGKSVDPNVLSFFVWAQGPLSPTDPARPVVLFHGTSRPLVDFSLRLSDTGNNCSAGNFAPAGSLSPQAASVESANLHANFAFCHSRDIVFLFPQLFKVKRILW
jgi:hypothetical protein